MEIAIASSVIAACIVGLINWLFAQPNKHRDQIHSIDVRLVQTEEKIKSVDGTLTKHDDSIEYIKNNMVCKEDFNQGLDRIESIVLNKNKTTKRK